MRETSSSTAVDVALAIVGFVVLATASLSAITGLTEVHPAVPVALAVVAALAGAAQVSLRGWVQSRVVPAEDVLEAVTRDGDVVAGPAADMATPGDVIRQHGQTVDGQPVPTIADLPDDGAHAAGRYADR